MTLNDIIWPQPKIRNFKSVAKMPLKMSKNFWLILERPFYSVSETNWKRNFQLNWKIWLRMFLKVTGMFHLWFDQNIWILLWNTLSNQQCESIFATFRRMEHENFSFQSLQVRAVCIQNKITEWLRSHENRTDLISKALRLVLKL